ncbi:MAG: aminotransferase class I/II-fold pyridoxal phosphate-dependent enzyme, partial [Eubacteriales bacterium]
MKLDFSANINPCGMPEAVRQALIRAAADCTAYPDPYCTALREKIAAAERVPESCVLCGNGAAELIYQYAYALPKDRPALIAAPSFCEYEQALCAAGIAAEHYLLREEDGFRLTGDFLRTDFSRYGAVFLCSPNNPTGITAEPALIRAAAASGVRLFCDFCFLDLTETPEKYDIPALIRDYPNLTVLRAFTKSYAMAGVRLGYMLCGDAAF